MPSAWEWIKNKGEGRVKKSLKKADRAKQVTEMLRSSWKSLAGESDRTKKIREDKNQEAVRD